MGCDIHAMIERRAIKNNPEEGEDPYYSWWINSGDPDFDRDYGLFEILAGVRGSKDRAISEPRGLPNNTCREMGHLHAAWGEDAHSASYLTLAEIVSATNSDTFKEANTYTQKTIRDLIEEMRHHMKLMPTTEGIGGRRVKDETAIRLVFFFDN